MLNWSKIDTVLLDMDGTLLDLHYLCASKSYADQYGLPSGPDEFGGYHFVGGVRDARPPFAVWMEKHAGNENIVVRGTEFRAGEEAVKAGMGIGFVSQQTLSEEDDLIEVMDPSDDWFAPLWLVTHVDLHRTPKVQAVLDYLKRAGKLMT